MELWRGKSLCMERGPGRRATEGRRRAVIRGSAQTRRELALTARSAIGRSASVIFSDRGKKKNNIDTNDLRYDL